jgi:hypothetical protein
MIPTPANNPLSRLTIRNGVFDPLSTGFQRGQTPQVYPLEGHTVGEKMRMRIYKSWGHQSTRKFKYFGISLIDILYLVIGSYGDNTVILDGYSFSPGT